MLWVQTTDTLPGNCAHWNVLITDEATGNGERIGALITDAGSSQCEPPSSFVLTHLSFVRQEGTFIRRPCFL